MQLRELSDAPEVKAIEFGFEHERDVMVIGR